MPQSGTGHRGTPGHLWGRRRVVEGAGMPRGRSSGQPGAALWRCFPRCRAVQSEIPRGRELRVCARAARAGLCVSAGLCVCEWLLCSCRCQAAWLGGNSAVL